MDRGGSNPRPPHGARSIPRDSIPGPPVSLILKVQHVHGMSRRRTRSGAMTISRRKSGFLRTSDRAHRSIRGSQLSLEGSTAHNMMVAPRIIELSQHKKSFARTAPITFTGHSHRLSSTACGRPSHSSSRDPAIRGISVCRYSARFRRRASASNRGSPRRLSKMGSGSCWIRIVRSSYAFMRHSIADSRSRSPV